MFVKVIFHGMLRKICPDVYEIEANTPVEAIRGITNQFRDKLIRRDGQRFVCSVKECPNDIDLNSCFRHDELNIYPAFCASGGGSRPGVVQMVVGAVLMVVGAVMVAAGVYFQQPWLIEAGLNAVFYGKLMFLGGALTYFLSPKLDTANSSDNPESSKAFGNSGNTTKIGTRIAIGYGKYKVAGQYLSINTSAISTKDGASVTSTIFGIGKKVIRPSEGVDRQ